MRCETAVNTSSWMAIDNRMLRDEPAGYAEYAAKVRYRLIPGIW
jgi:protein-S-isoprenylcysteine O-methyltransferase Ste14